MTEGRALKVFRTAIGFHDAFVAAPTKKAALEAWGSTRNLFALGDAEEVTDPALCKAPLARPGEVIKVSRGTAAEQLAALPADKPTARAKRSNAVAARPGGKALPRPKRTALDTAEQRLETARRDFASTRAAIQDQIVALEKQRSTIEARWARDSEALQSAVETQRRTYDDAVARWQAQDR